MRMPRGFRTNQSGGNIACPHRDVTCCPACAKAYVEIVEVYGQHFWMANQQEREAFIAEMKSS